MLELAGTRNARDRTVREPGGLYENPGYEYKSRGREGSLYETVWTRTKGENWKKEGGSTTRRLQMTGFDESNTASSREKKRGGNRTTGTGRTYDCPRGRRGSL